MRILNTINNTVLIITTTSLLALLPAPLAAILSLLSGRPLSLDPLLRPSRPPTLLVLQRQVKSSQGSKGTLLQRLCAALPKSYDHHRLRPERQTILSGSAANRAAQCSKPV